MHRIVVALLAAFDALIAVAVSVAVVAAPLTLFWATSLQAPWGALWPTTAKIWQVGHFVPQVINLPAELTYGLGIPAAAASFLFSLAPLGFAAFSALFAARSGVRAARSGAWLSGVLSGATIFALLTALIWWTSRNGIAAVWGWQALLFPALTYAIPLLAGAVITAWRDGDNGGIIDQLHDVVDGLGDQWSEAPSLVARGLAIIMIGWLGLGAAAVFGAIATNGADMIGLFQISRVDLWGAVLLTLAHLAYLPTLIVWGAAWVSGAGFSVGAGSSLTPAATDVGVVPALPILGLLPEHTPGWLIVVLLLPVGVAALAGWAMRSRYSAVLGDAEPWLPRIVMVGATTLLAAGLGATFAALTGGAIGPGRLEHVGASPGLVAMAVGLEALIGVGIVMLTPRPAAWRTAQILDEDVDAGDEEQPEVPATAVAERLSQLRAERAAVLAHDAPAEASATDDATAQDETAPLPDVDTWRG